MTIRGTLKKIKNFFLKMKEYKEAVDGFLITFRWILTIVGAISFGMHYFTAKTIISQKAEIESKNDTIKKAKIAYTKVANNSYDTIIKHKKVDGKLSATHPMK